MTPEEILQGIQQRAAATLNASSDAAGSPAAGTHRSDSCGMCSMSAVGISGLQAGEDVKFSEVADLIEQGVYHVGSV